MLRAIILILLVFVAVDAAQLRRLRRKNDNKGKKPSKQVCDRRCPCCSKLFPEFVSAIEAFHADPCDVSTCCYYRGDEESEILMVTECSEGSMSFNYNTAFMSFDYTGTYSGCTPGTTCRLCGDSVMGLPPIVLSGRQAAICEDLVRSSVTDDSVCFQDDNRGEEVYHPCRNNEPGEEPNTCRITTSAELQEALVPLDDSIVTVTLCPTTIHMEQTVTLPRHVVLECPPGSQCILDGQNQRRLLEFQADPAVPAEESFASMVFDNIIFQNGRGDGGGAIKLKGDNTASRAMFRNCTFLNNNGTYAQNGGAIAAWPWFALDIRNTSFIGNTAHTGGAIYALDTRIELVNSTFVNNAVCGGFEGPAIFLDVSEFPTPEHVHVACRGQSNVFRDNLDGICLDDDWQPQGDIVAPKILNCPGEV